MLSDSLIPAAIALLLALPASVEAAASISCDSKAITVTPAAGSYVETLSHWEIAAESLSTRGKTSKIATQAGDFTTLQLDALAALSGNGPLSVMMDDPSENPSRDKSSPLISGNLAPVPEPSGVLLCSLALSAILVDRRRR